MLPPDTLKASWLEREAEYSAFVNGPLLDFWSNGMSGHFRARMMSLSAMCSLPILRMTKCW